MNDWVKDQFLQAPIPDPWGEWKTVDLEYVVGPGRLEYPDDFRRKVRVEILARRAGKTYSQKRAERTTPNSGDEKHG